MKTLKKIMAVTLALCTMLSLFTVFCVTASADGVALGVDGSTLFTGEWDTEYPVKYPGIISYVDHSKTGNRVPAGWYTMVKDTDGYYKCPAGEGTWGYSFHAADTFCATRSDWHDELGWAFTAPYSGSVTFTFYYEAGTQYASDVSVGGKGNLWISSDEPGAYVRENGDVSYAGAIANYTRVAYTGTIPSRDDPSTKHELTFTVKQGVTYRFMNGSIDGADHQVFYNYPTRIEYNSITPSSAVVIGKGLAATDVILVRFFVQFDCPVDANVVVKATIATAGGDAVTDVLVPTQWIDTEGTYGRVTTAADNVYYYTVALTAKQMTETITLSVKIGGVEKLTVGNTYSVAQYCQTFIDAYNADHNDNPATAKACASMLLYGRMTQLALNYNTENLPEVDTALVTAILSEIQ